MKSTKTMLIAALAAGALLAGSSVLRAQDATNTPPAGEHSPGMRSHMNLTDAQKPQVEAIIKGAMEKRRALREDTSLTPEEKRDKAKAIQEDTSTQLKAVLTPEQFAKWQEMTKRGPHNHPPAGTPDSPKPSATAPPS